MTNKFTFKLSDVYLPVKKAFRERALSGRRAQGLRSYLTAHQVRKLQLGAGPNIMEGWFNVDLSLEEYPEQQGIFYVDVRKDLPFESGAFDFVFSEHLIEHLTYQEGLRMLGECHRILKAGGRLRVATPDFDIVMDLRNPQKTELQKAYIKWHIDTYFSDLGSSGVYDDLFVINNAFSGFGHRFLYDYDALRGSLHKAGFVDIVRFSPGESEDENFRDVDFRARDEMTKFTGLVLEARRP